VTPGIPWSRTTTIALSFAVVWAALLLVAAFVLPAYACAIPFVTSLLVAGALASRRRRLGWVLTSVLGLFTLLVMLSIGIFFLPTTMALVVACAATERRRVAHPADEPSPLTA
jgi:lysylphosphatidylglycerol synthetase-like protein (DUF2156 family)